MEFPQKLYELRKTKGLSQGALAQELDVSRQAGSKWESGTAMPETDKLIREVPPEKSLEALQKIWELAGIIVDEKR